jgi:hypothetical protein
MKNLNKIYLSFIVILLLAVCLSYAKASVLDINLEQEPYPAQISQSLELNFQVENTGTENLTITFNLDVDDPLTLISNQEKTLTINAGDTKTLTYDVRIDGDAQEGQEQVTLKYEIDSEDYDEDFDVLIAPQQVYLQVVQVTSVPEKVAPGETLVLNVLVKNTANSEIRDAILSLDLSNMPLAPESVTEQRIDNLGKQEERQVTFNLIVLPSAQIQTYKIPLEINYYDEFGKLYSREDLVSINVFEEPSIEVSVDTNKLILNTDSKISLKVLNKGLGEINFVELRILPQTSYYQVTQDYGYLGNIASDDYNSADFMLVPKQQEIVMQVAIDYRDSNNQKYSEIKTLNVHAYNLQEAQRQGLLPAFPWLTIIIVLVIIAVVVFFILRRRKRKKLLQQG